MAETKKGRAPAKEKAHNLFLRIPPDIIDALDDEVEEMQREKPGLSGITRTDVIRGILYRHVQARRAAKKPAKR